MTFTNLEKAIEELNAPKVYEDGEEMESSFKFTYSYSSLNKYIYIYDINEAYSIDYLDELNSLGRLYAREFGFEYQPTTEDEIFNKLEKAIKKDLGKDKYIEWEDNIVMSVYF